MSKRFKTVDYHNRMGERNHEAGLLYTQLGGGEAIAIPVLNYSPAEDRGCDEPPIPACCEISEDIARLLAEELAERLAATPEYPAKGWHPVFLPSSVKVVYPIGEKSKWFGETDPKAFIAAFGK